MTDDWLRITKHPSSLDDPDWQQADQERWDRERELEDQLRRTGVDPVVHQIRTSEEDE